MRDTTLLMAILAFGGCSYEAQVPLIDGSLTAGVGGKQTGRFAIMIGTDGLMMKAEVVGFYCAIDSFPIDLSRTWKQAMVGALYAALERVDVVPTALPPAQLQAGHYDAQILISPSNAASRVRVASSLLGGHAEAASYLTGTLTVAFPDGHHAQELLQGRGGATNDQFSCPRAGQVVAEAGAAAVKDIVGRTAIAVKQVLADHRPASPTPAIAGAAPIPSAPRPLPSSPNVVIPSATVKPTPSARDQTVFETTSKDEVRLENIRGAYLVPVRVNGIITLNFVLDSGATDVLIPEDVALTLARTSTISARDFIGKQTYSLANGEELPSLRFMLRELKVGDHVVKNVTASLGPVRSDPLLGKSFLDKFASVKIDNNRHVLVLADKVPQ